jgi:transposase
MARKTFKFRLYSNRQQREKLLTTLDLCRELYNAGLQERIDAWKNRTPVNCYDQINQLPAIKEIREDLAGVFSQVLQDTLRRLDKTYKAFFGRVQRGEKAGFPRFKGRHRYNIKGLSGGLLSKAVHDVGWSSFTNMLSYKAENAGRQLLKVDPNYTSQECPNCHAIKEKQLSERVHRCDCGLTIHRDHAAALVILGRGLRLPKPEVRVSVA